MAQQTNQQLLDSAEVIHDETQVNANTTERVGQMLYDIIDSKAHIELVEGIQDIETNYTAERYDFYLSCHNGINTLQLPDGVDGKYYFVNNRKTTGDVLIVAVTGEEINEDGASYTLTNGDACFIKYNNLRTSWELVVIPSNSVQDIEAVLGVGNELADGQSVQFGNWEWRRTGTTLELYNNVEEDVQLKFDAFKDVTEGIHAFVGKELFRVDGVTGSSNASFTLPEDVNYYIGLPNEDQAVTVPEAWSGKQYTIDNGSDYDITLQSAGAQTFGSDADSTYVVPAGEKIIITRFVSNWRVFESSTGAELKYRQVSGDITADEDDHYFFIKVNNPRIIIPDSESAKTYVIINPEGYDIRLNAANNEEFEPTGATSWTTSNKYFSIVKDDQGSTGTWHYIPDTDYTQNTVTTAGGAEEISYKLTRNAKLILEGSVSTLNLTDITPGRFSLLVQQDATGGRTLTGIQRNGVGADVEWIEGSEQGVNSGANAYTLYKFYDDGSNLIARRVSNYLQSGDNVSELANDSGYLTSLEDGEVYESIGSDTTIDGDETIINITAPCDITIPDTGWTEGRRVHFVNHECHRVTFGTDFIEFVGVDDASYNEVQSKYFDLVVTSNGSGGLSDEGLEIINIEKGGEITGFDNGTSIHFELYRGYSHHFTLGADREAAYFFPVKGAEYQIRLKQNGTGGHEITSWSGVTWIGGVAPTLNSGANENTIIKLFYDGSTMYGWAPVQAPGYLQNVVEDTTPELGGDLAGGGNDISGVGNVSASTMEAFKYNLAFIQTITSATTVNWNTTSPVAKITIGHDITEFDITNAVNGDALTLRIIQDGTGGRTITGWEKDGVAADVLWPDGVEPTLSTAAGSVDIITFHCDDSKLYGIIQENFQAAP